MATLSFDSSFKFNKLLWLSSAGDPDTNATARMVHDVEATAKRYSLAFEHIQIKDRAHFNEEMTTLIGNAALYGDKPLLHIDMHGCKEKGLKLSSTSSYIPWEDFSRITRALNKATQNNLLIVGAACYALHSIKHVRITEAAPYYTLLAPEHQVQMGFLESNIHPFYEEILETGDLDAAYGKYLSPSFKYFHCEKALTEAVVRYIITHATNARRQERAEDIITYAVENCPPDKEIKINQARRIVKEGLKASQRLLDTFSKVFLVGKECHVTIDDILQFIDDLRAKR